MGKLVHVTDSESAFMSLFASILSVVTCLMVVISIYHDAKTLKKSYHLRLVQRLLISDIGLSSCVIFYYIMQFLVTSSELKIFCNLYLPTVVFFFLCSYGWTVLLAFRFRSSHTEKKTAGPPVPMYVIWAIPVPFALAVLIAAFSTGDVTTVESNDADTNQSCTFNHDKLTGIILDLMTFQGPLLVTIIVNCYSYTKGLLALSNTPHSVVARQMRKAGGYLGVLLVVWVPNIVYNFLTIFDGSDSQYNAFLDVVIFLSSLQVFGTIYPLCCFSHSVWLTLFFTGISKCVCLCVVEPADAQLVLETLLLLRVVRQESPGLHLSGRPGGRGARGDEQPPQLDQPAQAECARRQQRRRRGHDRGGQRRALLTVEPTKGVSVFQRAPQRDHGRPRLVVSGRQSQQLWQHNRPVHGVQPAGAGGR